MGMNEEVTEQSLNSASILWEARWKSAVLFKGAPKIIQSTHLSFYNTLAAVNTGHEMHG